MSSGFYAECLEEIAQLIRQGRIPEARAKVDTELAMPYVPSDVLPALQDFDRQLRLIAAENRKPGAGVMSLEEIEAEVYADPNPFPPVSAELVMMILLPVAGVFVGFRLLMRLLRKTGRHKKGRVPKPRNRFYR